MGRLGKWFFQLGMTVSVCARGGVMVHYSASSARTSALHNVNSPRNSLPHLQHNLPGSLQTRERPHIVYLNVRLCVSTQQMLPSSC